MIDCKFCGKEHLKSKEDCPAWGKRCANYGDRNHFTIKWKKESRKQGEKWKSKGKVHFVDDNESDSEDKDYVLQVDSGESNASDSTINYPKIIIAKLSLNNLPVQFQINCGATVNILPVDRYQHIFNDPTLQLHEEAKTTLVMFHNTEMKPLGKISVQTTNPKNHKSYLVTTWLFWMATYHC